MTWRGKPWFGALATMITGGSFALSLDVGPIGPLALVAPVPLLARAYAGEAEDLETAPAFAQAIRTLAPSRPEFIVLPEKQLGGARGGAASSAVLAAASAAASTTVIAGFDEVLPDGARVNSAQVLAPGQAVQRYVKRRLIPGLEPGYTTGADSMVLGTRGVAICKDLDFAGMIRRYGQRGVQLLLVPAWDFVIDGRMHSRMALVRGVENGFAVARAAAAGKLTASDRYGRVIAEATTSRERPVTVVTGLGIRGGGTWYARVGDVFGWACAIGVALLIGWRARRAWPRGS